MICNGHWAGASTKVHNPSPPQTNLLYWNPSCFILLSLLPVSHEKRICERGMRLIILRPVRLLNFWVLFIARHQHKIAHISFHLARSPLENLFVVRENLHKDIKIEINSTKAACQLKTMRQQGNLSEKTNLWEKIPVINSRLWR